MYSNLAGATDMVIHNAWPVDFNRNFSSFKPSIDGVTNFITFCLSQSQAATGNEPPRSSGNISGTGNKPIKMLFISSVGATSNWGSAAPTSRSQVPELELTDWKVARTGYGQSKLLSERLLAHAAATMSLPIAIVRVGQLCGPVLHGLEGKWTEREWLPSLIRSSFTLKALPETLGPTETVDWVPVDLAAQVVVELGIYFSSGTAPEASGRKKKKKRSTHFFHVVNPKQASWSDLVPALWYHVPSGTKLVPFIEWVDILKKSAEEAGGFQGVDEGVNPAAKLIDFFDNLQDRAIRFPHAKVAELETKNTEKVSPTLAGLQPVNTTWIDLWLRQWDWDRRAQRRPPLSIPQARRTSSLAAPNPSSIAPRQAPSRMQKLSLPQLNTALSWNPLSHSGSRTQLMPDRPQLPSSAEPKTSMSGSLQTLNQDQRVHEVQEGLGR